jgi:hypothetical protein
LTGRNLILIILINAATLCAQDSASVVRKNILSLSYGIPNAGKVLFRKDMEAQVQHLARTGITNTSDLRYEATGFGPFFFSSEHRVSAAISYGPVFGFSKATITHVFLQPGNGQGLNVKTNNNELNYYSLQSFFFGLRGRIYLSKKPKHEMYVSVSAGYNHTIEDVSDFYPNTYFLRAPKMGNPWFTGGPEILLDVYSPFFWGLTWGVRQYIWKNSGLFAELGCDKWSFVQAGIFIRSR